MEGIVARPQSLVHRILCKKIVDRTVALGLCFIGLYQIGLNLSSKNGFALCLVLLIGVSHNLLLAIRYPPRCVSMIWQHWVIALSGAHWHLVYALADVQPNAIMLAPVTKSLSLAGAIIFLSSRFVLGRNFGIVPALRRLVVSGPYGLVRHPIYTSSILTSLAFVLENFAVRAVVLWAIGVGLMVMKLSFEERFLGTMGAYASYKQKVPYRLIPGVW